jgi:hypothetical protein
VLVFGSPRCRHDNFHGVHNLGLHPALLRQEESRLDFLQRNFQALLPPTPVQFDFCYRLDIEVPHSFDKEKNVLDTSILQAALIGLESEKEKIDTAMAAIRKQLGGRGTAEKAVATNGAKPRRQMSAAAKKHIADAQHKRWAAFHAKQAAAAKKAAPKRKLSPAAKAKLAANLAKARAAKAQKTAAATA